MADTFWSLPKGGSFGAVTTGAATSGQSLELRLHTGDGFTKAEVLRALQAIEAAISQGSELS
jgi:hypothetical protein